MVTKVFLIQLFKMKVCTGGLIGGFLREVLILSVVLLKIDAILRMRHSSEESSKEEFLNREFFATVSYLLVEPSKCSG